MGHTCAALVSWLLSDCSWALLVLGAAFWALVYLGLFLEARTWLGRSCGLEATPAPLNFDILVMFLELRSWRHQRQFLLLCVRTANEANSRKPFPPMGGLLLVCCWSSAPGDTGANRLRY